MPEDYSAVIAEGAALEARVLSGQPATPPAASAPPPPPVQTTAKPVEPVAPAAGQPETDEALEARLQAAHQAVLDAEAAAVRMEMQRAGNEALMRSVLNSRGIDYEPGRMDQTPATPPISVPRRGHQEPPAAPMSADVLYALRIFQHNNPTIDLWGTNVPGSRR
jgi:hypothetical protein